MPASLSHGDTHPRVGAPGTDNLLALLAAPAAPDGALLTALQRLRPQEQPALLERLAFHRIDGLAHRALSRLPQNGIDPWLRSALKRRYQRCAAATLAHGLALAELLEALHHAGCPVLVMRGLRCVESAYGDPGVRPFEDHDLLVRRRDEAAAAALLRRHGFDLEAAGLYRRGGLIVDLHTDPWGARRRPSRAALFPLPVGALFDRAVPGRIAGAPAPLLALEDDLLLTAIHLVKHSFDRLIRTADLAHLLARRGRELVWETLLQRADAAGATRILGWALRAAEWLGADVPTAFVPPVSGRLERLLMGRVLDLRPWPYTGEMLMALAAPGWKVRLHFLMDALLPEGETPAAPLARAATLPGRTMSLVRQAGRQSAERRRAR
jgi:Uncharacterised nucleotidyltransferase